MATLKAVFDRETGRTPELVITHRELDALVDRVRALSVGNPVPSITEFAVNDDPYGFPHLYAGIGADTGFVQELWEPARSTLGDPDRTDRVLFDFMAHTQEIPAAQVVDLATVRAVLAAYLDHGGRIPQDHPHLHPVAEQPLSRS